MNTYIPKYEGKNIYCTAVMRYRKDSDWYDMNNVPRYEKYPFNFSIQSLQLHYVRYHRTDHLLSLSKSDNGINIVKRSDDVGYDLLKYRKTVF